MNISYTIKSLFRLDIRSRLQDAADVAARSGRCLAAVLLDMAYCGIRYGAGPVDYKVFEFYRKTPAQRATYITRGINNDLVKHFNDRKYRTYFDNKSVQNAKFAPLLGRSWLSTETMSREGFRRFCKGKTAFLYKPNGGSCGHGIHKYTLTGDEDALYRHLKDLAPGVIEELVCQHSDLAALYPGAVNTVRVVTICRNGVCTPLFAFLRMGTGESCVDNLNSGGIAAKVDIQTGTVLSLGAAKDGALYDAHPATGVPIPGIAIPHWQQVLDLTRAAARFVPQVGYVGWDVAVREADAVLIEGNCYPGHDILQLPAYTPEGNGLLASITPYL